MLSIKQFRLVFCWFQLNQNIETICFGIEPKHPETSGCKTNQNKPKQTKTNQNKPKQTKTNRNNSIFCEKNTIYALYHTFSVALLFSFEPKQPKQTFCFGQCRNQFRFEFRLFRIETSFERHPSPNIVGGSLL